MRILLAEDEPHLRTVVATHLGRKGHMVTCARDGREALAILEGEAVDLVVTDLRMPILDGLSLMDRARTAAPRALFIVITAHATVDNAIGALRRGAFDYITKPFDLEDLSAAVAKAGAHLAGLDREVSRGPGEAAPSVFTRIVGRTAAMKAVQALIEQAASSDSTVLVVGESGTGKELVGRMIHDLSPRAAGPYVVVNCAALPDALVESELFGFERGAFTGAVEKKPGRFELADRGTLFLDEVGEIPTHLQAKLLRVLQSRTFERLGGLEPIEVDTRLVAATHRDLKTEVREGRFRQDLYYRLNVVEVVLPPLRQRIEDVPELATSMLERLRGRTRRRVDRISPEAMDLLRTHSWPGNVRELENVIERAMVLCTDDCIRPGHLPDDITGRGVPPRIPEAAQPTHDPASDPAGLRRTLRESQAHVERQMILEALEKTRWNRTRAARLLGISRRSLHSKIAAYGLDRDPGD